MPSVHDLKQNRKALQDRRDDIDRLEAALAKEAHELHKRIVSQHAAADKARKRDDEKRLADIKARLDKLAREREDVRQRLEGAEDRDKSLIGRIRLLRKRIKAKLRRRKQNKSIDISAGSPHWGGSDDVIRKFGDPVAADFGAPVTSRKRAANDPLTIANPSSDHSVLAITASAADYGTFSGSGLAYAIARAFGIAGYSTGNYNGYNVTIDGHVYRVQILWAVSGHFNHVHLGVRRVS